MTKKLAVLAVITGLAGASCSGGHGMGSFLPGGAAAPRGAHVSDAIVAPPGWAATATRGATLPAGTDRGPLSPSTPMTVRVGLNLHNVDQLASAIAAPGKHAPMSTAQFAAQYGPTQSETAAVVAYLQGQGFRNVQADTQLVSADGTAGQVAKAFNTSLEAFSLGGASVYVNTQPALVPASLGGIVSAVLGLSNAATMSVRPNVTRVHASCLITAAPTGQCAPAFNAADVQKFYHVGYVPDGSDTTVAVIAAGDVSGSVADLQYAETKQNLPHVPVNVVTVGLPSSDTSGVVEWDLDSQSSTGMAQNVQALYFYATTSLSDSDIANAYSKWVTQNVARLGNSSFGECEYSAWLDGAMKVDDNLFMQAAAQGQTMFASSGDTGSACALAPTNGAPGSGPPFVSYPAASPYVVAVGGTTVVANASDASYVGEAAWNAGGGGLSQFENSASWQRAVIPSSTGLAATNMRGVPDIAMAADAFSGAYFVYGANIPGVGDCSAGCAIGGTSEASPLAMGSYARMMSWTVNMLGYAPRWFYRNYLQNQNSATTVTGPPPTQALGGFHDIITGANGAFTALPGYDYTTGLGTFDIQVMGDEIGS